jgi:hypothetical protein
MADSRYIIELILNAKDNTSGALASFATGQKRLQELTENTNERLNRQNEALGRLSDTTASETEELKKLNEAYEISNERRNTNNFISSEEARQQVRLTSAARNYLKVQSDQASNEDDITVALKSRTAAEKELESAIVDRIAGVADIRSDDPAIDAKAIREARALTRELYGDEIDSEINIFLEERNDLLKETIKSEKTLSAIKSQSSRDGILKGLQREGELIKKNGYADDEVSNRSALNIRRLGIEWQRAGGSVEDFEKAKKKALSIDRGDIGRISSAFINFDKSIKEAKKRNAEAQLAAGQGNENLKIVAELEYEKAVAQAEIAKEFLQTILGHVETNVDLDTGGLIAQIPEIEAIKKIIGRDIKTNIEFDVDNTSLAKLGAFAALKGLGEAVGQGFQSASIGIASFDNLIRGILVLSVAVFFQQIFVAVIGLAAGLAALASSAIAAGAALGGALTAGIAQAIPAVGVLLAFINRFSNVLNAVKQANLVQQQESYKGAKAATAQAGALNGIISAQERVAEAQKKLNEARIKARQVLEDLILSERKQTLGLEQSKLAVSQAISSGAGSLAVAQKQIAVEEASSGLGKTRTDISSRQSKGIEGSPEVTDAKKALLDAQRALEQAQQSVTSAGDNMGAVTGKLDFMTSKLSKAERQLYNSILRLQEDFIGVGAKITEPLTKAFTFAVNRIDQILKDSGIVKTGIMISEALANSFRQVFNFILSDETVARFKVFSQQFVDNLKPLTSIAINILKIFYDLAELGAPVLSAILNYLDDLIQKFADFTSSTGSGRDGIAKFFDAGTKALFQFLELFGSIGKVIIALIGPAGGLKAGSAVLELLITTFDNLAKSITDKDTKIGSFFRRFFAYAPELLKSFAPIFSAIGGAIDKIFSPQGMDNVNGFARFIAEIFVPGLEMAIDFLAKVTTGITDLTKTFPILNKAFAFGFGALITGGILGRVVALLGPLKTVSQYLFLGKAGTPNIFTKLAEDTNLAQSKLQKYLTAAGDVDSLFAKSSKSPLGKMKGRADDLAEAAASAGTLIRDPETGQLRNSATGRFAKEPAKRGLVKRVVQAPKRVIQGAGFAGGAAALAGSAGGAGGLAPALGAILGPVGLVAAAIALIVGSVVALLALSGRLDDVWKAIKDTFSAVFSQIKKALGELAMELTGDKSVKAAFNSIVDVLKDVGSFLADVLIPYIKLLGVFIGTVVVTGIQRITSIVRFVKSVVKNVIQIFSGLKEFWDGVFSLDGEKILSGLSQLSSGILGIFQSLGALILDVLTSPFRALGGVIESIFPGIGDFITREFEKAINKNIDNINGFIGFYNDTAGLVTGEIGEIPHIGGGGSGGKSPAGKTQKSPKASGEQKYGREDQQNRRGITPAKADKKDKSPAKAKAATKADNQDANAFLNTFDPQTVQLSDAIVKKLSSYWRTLRRAARDSVNDVIEFLKDLRGAQGNGRVDKFVTLAISDFKRLRTGVRTHMVGISNIVQNQMQNASMAVYKGAKYMKEALNDALKSVGGKEIDLSIKVPKIKQAEGNASGGFVGRADGGWIGNRGERGKDEVHTILGRGEAVLNWGQQRVVEPALRQVYGFGLDEMFGRTRGLHAGGSASPGLARGGRPFRRGRASWFGGPNDGMNIGTAIGVPDTTPGIALYNQKTLRKWFDVVSPSGRKARLKQIDFGPAPWTGKTLDITSAALKYFGFNEKNFPTGVGNWSVFGPYNGRGSNSNTSTGGTPAEIAMAKVEGGSKAMRDIVSKGLEKYRSAANKKIEKETPQEVTGGSLSVPRGTASPNLRQAIAMGERMGLNLSSFLRPGDLDSFHSQGRAADLAGSPAQMASFFRWALKRYGRRLTELFYDPLGGIDNGQSIGAIGGHTDHVHIAFNRGGRVTEELLKKREKEARMKKRLGGLKKYARGGMVDGKDGQEVPIVAHAGEWVVNKMQQAKLAMMAGTTPEKVKNALGFGGGPTSFAKGGEVKELTTGKIQPGALTVLSSYNTFTSAIDKAFSFIDGQIKKNLGNISNKKFSKNLDKMLKSIRLLTNDGAGLNLLADQIARTFESAQSAAKLAAAGFVVVGRNLKKITTGAAFEKAINPEEIAKEEAKLQQQLQGKLIKLRQGFTRTLARINTIIKKSKLGTTTVIQVQADKIQQEIDKLEKNDEDAGQKKRIKELQKRLKEKEKQLKDRQGLDTEKIKLENSIKELNDQIAQTEIDRLEALKTEFEEGTKRLLKESDTSTRAAGWAKSIAELTGNVPGVTGALTTIATDARTKLDLLKTRLEAAREKAKTDPRWQSVVDELEQQVGDQTVTAVQAAADAVSGALGTIDEAFTKSETIRGLSDRAATIMERIGGSNARQGAFETRLANSQSKGTSLSAQQDLIKDLMKTPDALSNPKTMADLQAKLDDLKKAIEENSLDTRDLTIQYRQAQLDLINEKTNRTTGILGSVTTILGNIARATGGAQSTESQISIAEGIRTALGLEQGSIIEAIFKAIADNNFGSEANAILAQLQAAFTSGDPASFAALLEALGPRISLLAESITDPATKALFNGLIDSMTNNTIATTDNTANLAELNGLANQPQQFATTAWTKFRTALFNGVGDILPQFQVPAMATGGYITKGGLFQLHPGEFVVNAQQTNAPADGPINITVNEANKPLDVTALASRIAFEKRTRR